ncbi:MAG: hypothetical protein NVSMB25_00650 [Thermoleophilaceae bacterium]
MLAEIAVACEPSLAAHAVTDPPAGRWEGRLADPDRAFVFESIYEGFQLHHGEPRLFRDMDPDLRLLAGDALYALGLERLADRGDLAAVAELADLISLSARAVAEQRVDIVDELWEESLRALCGATGSAGVRAGVGTRLDAAAGRPGRGPGGGARA